MKASHLVLAPALFQCAWAQLTLNVYSDACTTGIASQTIPTSATCVKLVAAAQKKMFPDATGDVWVGYKAVEGLEGTFYVPTSKEDKKTCETDLDLMIALADKSTQYEIDTCIDTGGDYKIDVVVPAGSNEPCFHSASMATRANGAPVRVDELKEGDAIIAATAEGNITIDTVSMLSIAKPEAEATFVVLATDTNEKLTLTGGHHLPVGERCCSTLKKAEDVAVGDKVWAVGAGSKAVARTVAKKGLEKSKGLHSPVLTNGGFPVIDGVVTSFDSLDKVTLAKHALAPLIAACKATGTCLMYRHMFFSGDDAKYLA